MLDIVLQVRHARPQDVQTALREQTLEGGTAPGTEGRADLTRALLSSSFITQHSQQDYLRKLETIY